MDNLKKTRSAKRSGFTRSHGQLVTALGLEQPDLDELRAHFAMLRDKTTELQRLDEEIMGAMQENDEVPEDTVIAEVSSCDEYQLKYHQIKQKVMRLTDPAPIPPTAQPQ